MGTQTYAPTGYYLITNMSFSIPFSIKTIQNKRKQKQKHYGDIHMRLYTHTCVYVKNKNFQSVICCFDKGHLFKQTNGTAIRNAWAKCLQSFTKKTL